MKYSMVLRKINKHLNALNVAIDEIDDAQKSIDTRQAADVCNTHLIESLAKMKEAKTSLTLASDNCPKENQ
jgi:predicted choloylglycine hydrolase